MEGARAKYSGLVVTGTRSRMIVLSSRGQVKERR